MAEIIIIPYSAFIFWLNTAVTLHFDYFRVFSLFGQDGGVFTCGEGSKGQLGHGSLGSISTPRKVAELMGTVVSQIACGRYTYTKLFI